MENIDKNILQKLLENKHNEQEIRSLRVFYKDIDIEAELEKYMNNIEKLELSEHEASGKQSKKLKILSGTQLKTFLRIAATIVIFFGLGTVFSWIFLGKGNSDILTINALHEIEVPKGGKSIITLPDGTKVWLNAGTRLKYSNTYGINDRKVELEGEAYFKVKTNPEKPFIVQTSELSVMAYGTSFNVKAYPDEKVISTTLEEGIVKIEGEKLKISLKPNQCLTYIKKKAPEIENPIIAKHDSIKTYNKDYQKVEKIKPITTVNVEKITAWKDNRLIIESETIADIAVVLERRFNVKVNIISEGLLEYRFRGVFYNETLEQILSVIQLSAPIEYRIDKGIVTIKTDTKRINLFLESTE